jgi:hypothetical protein
MTLPKPITRKPAMQPVLSIPEIPLPDQSLADQNIVQAMINCGRWVVRCPDDPRGLHVAEVTEDQATFICPGCYPDTRALAFVQGEDGLFRPTPDIATRQVAIDQATADGCVYAIQFPDNAADIWDALRQRPTANMNWLPDETLDFLLQENTDHGVGDIQPDVSVSGGK